ncbi:hypothetical protein C0992_011726 [Termitomyces sp. T32_za158]|nr:hypothetical protein C0992_011726 [Termitomyces sp. T32_za158]
MDDPWANAWGEPAKPQPSVALPSWSTDTPVSWTEPSPAPWASSDPAPTGWTSPDDDAETPCDPLSASPQVDDQTPPPPPELVLPEATSKSVQETDPVPPASPDACDSLETILQSDQPDLDPWAAGSVVSSADPELEDVWVHSWKAPDPEVRTEEPADEWEEAKRQKARQDEYVPPELLVSILDDFKSLSGDLWPPQSPPEGHSGARSGLESVEGLDHITNRLIPHDLTLPSSVKFSQTFIAKHMGEALRLSRHVPITRLSPLTLYMASKGSTAWEISVKSHIEVGNDDLLPSGWRVVEKEKEDPVIAVEMKKKGSGGLLSFFGRKATNTQVESNPRRSQSPGRTVSISTTIPSSSGSVTSPVTHSARPSLESTNSTIPNLSTSGTAINSTPQSSSQTTVPGIAEQTQAPSAVSRFLGRFARSKTTGSGTKESLALSTDDLEFLSEIVPSANDDVDENDQMRGLSDMLNRSPLPTTLPPLLAPPPRAPPISLISKNLTQLSEPASNPQEDLFSVFDPPPTPSRSTTPVVQPNSPSRPLQLPSTSIAPLRPQTDSLPKGDTQGVPSSSRLGGRSSTPFDTSALTSQSQTLSSGRRAPMAIMSTGSSSSKSSRSTATLPLPPILPPPPPSKFTSTSHSRASSQYNIFADDNSLASYRPSPVSQPSLLSDTTTPSAFSEQSLFSDTSSHQEKSDNDFFDDFDDFVSSPISDAFPPRPPAKPSHLSQPSMAPPAKVPPQTQPPTKHPSPPPRKVSRAADHQRTLSLVNRAANHAGRWPAPPSPLPEPLAPPPGRSHAPSTPNTAGPLSSMQTQQKNAIAALNSSTTSSGYPFFPPPPGFSGLQTSTISPSPPPRLAAASPAPIVNLMQNGRGASPAPVPAAPKHTPLATPGGLSAQDLSFFEGL